MAHSITILGTGGDSIVVGRQLRASGGIVITTAENQIHLDPGPGALIGLKQHGLHPRETTAVLLSHQHVNHATEAAALITAMTHNGMDRRGVLVTNDLERGLVPLHQRHLLERAFALQPRGRVGINDVEVKAFAAKHYDSDALHYLIQTPDYSLGYITDTAYVKSLADTFKDATVLIINCKYPDNTAEGDHLDIDAVRKLLTEVSPQLAIITHFGAKMLDADPLAQARTLHRDTGVQVVAGKDGLRISPSHYDAKRRQKTLKRY